MELIYDKIRPTVGYFKGQDGICRVRVYRDDMTEDPKGRYVILVSELHENQGMSVTNSIERIVGRVIQELELFYSSITVIEYLPEDLRYSNSARDEEFSVVTFSRQPNGKRNDPAKAHWTFIERKAVEEIVGQPISKRARE